jgi:hypothetical protein
MIDHQRIFTPQYIERSGPGSTKEYSEPYRKFLESFIVEHDIKSIIDLGCGDFEIMRHVDLNDAWYVGVDCIIERVRANRKLVPFEGMHTFMCDDARRIDWSYVLGFGLVLVKDVLQHWSNAEVQAWLDVYACDQVEQVRPADMPKTRFLITNCNYGPTVNTDIETGGWRALDLTKEPFSVGTVVFQWGDDVAGHKDVVLIER